MKTRFHAAQVISKRMLFEMFIHPWFYVFLAFSLAGGLSVVWTFVQSIGTSGIFRFSQEGLQDPSLRFLLSSFGSTFCEKIFREGPFFFALCYSSLPVFLYLSMSAAFTFGNERTAGAIELITYGPADGTSCFLALLMRNMAGSIIMLITLILFFFIAAFLNNIALGYIFFYTLLLIFFLFLSMYSYVIFASVLSNSSSSSLALTIFFYLFFFSLQIGSFQIVQQDVRQYVHSIFLVARWISPLYYWTKGIEAAGYGNIPGYFLSLLFLFLLSFVLLCASHFILKRKGVRG
jgi:hypothetical protein